MKKKPSNHAAVLVRIPRDIKDALAEIAEADTRSVASLIHKIIKEYLASKRSKK